MVLRNRRNRRNGLSTRNQHEIHENDYVLREMCALLYYQAKVITLSGKRRLLHYRLKIITLSVSKFITLSADVITLSVGYYINGRFYYIIGQLLH